MKTLQLIAPAIFFFVFSLATTAYGDVHFYDFVLKETNVTKLCVGRQILTVNDSFPGPEIRVHKGDTVYVNVYNHGLYGVTLHWHGVKNPRNSWSDGPEYITQCGIEPGTNFTYEVILSEEEGTLWWHAHSDWTRATVHGAIVILPKQGTTFPFPQPDGDELLILADWYKEDVNEAVDFALGTGTDIPHTSGYAINGQLGYFSNCSSDETIYYWTVDYGKTYHLRIINAVLNDELFFAIANHSLTVVGMDGSYVKPFVTTRIVISPGNTVDVLVTTNQSTDNRYYMATRQFSSENQQLTYEVGTAILQYYEGSNGSKSSPIFPTDTLPYNHGFDAADNYTRQLRSLASEDHPISVPLDITTRMYIVVTMNDLPCPERVNCNITDDDGYMLGSSMNNISWWADTRTSILQAYYRLDLVEIGPKTRPVSNGPIWTDWFFPTLCISPSSFNSKLDGAKKVQIHISSANNVQKNPNKLTKHACSNISGKYTTDFPDWPTTFFNFTGDVTNYTVADFGTKVKVLEYNETVEIVFQGTALLDGSGNHPMHMHGYSFYVVGRGLGNFNNETDPSSYNLVDPPLVNTFSVPKLGWLAIRFKASNPGVWYWHCHLDRHMSWGMDTVFIVKDGGTKETSLRPPPTDMPVCSNSTKPTRTSNPISSLFADIDSFI